MSSVFFDRQDAGSRLALSLARYNKKPVVVYALPRGGVLVALEIAKKLKVPLDLIITRKIGHPEQPEYAVAAISENGNLVGDKEAMQEIDQEWLLEKILKEKKEAKRRREVYLHGRKPVSARGMHAILVDDGVATGLTMKAAIQEVGRMRPKKIIVALPVGPEEVMRELRDLVDEVVCLQVPKKGEFLGSIGEYYEFFPQLSDRDVIHALKDGKEES